MSHGKPILGYRNNLKGATFRAGSQVQVAPASNLATDIGAEPWQTAGVRTVENGAWVEIDAGEEVAWRAFWIGRSNLTDEAEVRFLLGSTKGLSDIYDSGPLGGLVPGYQQLVHVADADIMARYLRIEVDDPDNPDGFIRIGLAYGGSVFQPQRGIEYGASFGVAGLRQDITTRGGQTYPVALYQQRQWQVSFPALTEAEMYGEGLEIQRAAEMGANVLFVPRPGNGREQQEAVFGMLQSRSTFGFPHWGLRSWAFTVTERL